VLNETYGEFAGKPGARKSWPGSALDHTIALVRSEDTDTLIVLAPDQASFYEFLKSRQAGRTVVILERRRTQRRRPARTRSPERRSADRRTDTPEAALALMSVLGFMILHRGGRGWTA
jgi:hypothetical protein